MNQQKHVIQRQIIELKVRDQEQARQLQAQFSRLNHERIVPLIDLCCTELVEADRICRIGTLEVDIGYLDPSRLEEDFVSKLLPALRAALEEQIRHQEREAGPRAPSPRAASDLELLAFFARTGSLPWWADATRTQVLQEALSRLIRSAPEPLRRLAGELAREPRSLRRIAYHYDDEALSALLGLLSPSMAATLAGVPGEIATVLGGTPVAAARSETQIRHVVWQSTLYVASLETVPSTSALQFTKEVLTRTAVELGVSYSALVLNMTQAMPEAGVRPRGQLAGVLQALRAALPPPPAATENLPSDTRASQPEDVRREDSWAALVDLARQLPSPYRVHFRAALRSIQGSVSTGAMAEGDAFRQVVGVLRPAMVNRSLSTAAIRDLLRALQKLGAATGLTSEEVSGLTARLQDALTEPGLSVEAGIEGAETERTVVDLSFSDTGRLYVQNSGLVILWPFLERFFLHQGLTEGDIFKDTAAVHRAIGLLQYVATGEPSFPEHLLPLNKVLCGLDLTEVFDFGPQLLESEAEECANLLTAAIQHAAVLRDMSIPGFRSSFLLREGVLSARDGAWLLQVERRTHDIVLDLFPWSIQWLRLPWMEAPLRVEW